MQYVRQHNVTVWLQYEKPHRKLYRPQWYGWQPRFTEVTGYNKKIIYSSGTHNFNVQHNKAMAHMNLMNLYQDKFQDIQEFCDQYLAMQKGWILDNAQMMQRQC